MISKLRQSVSKQINGQMVYRKYANKSRVSGSLPNMTLLQVSLREHVDPDWALT